MKETPLPCPLCGADPRLVDLAGWEIHCDCGIGMVIDSPKEADVVRAWNRRATVSVKRGEDMRDARRYQVIRDYHPGLLLDMLTDRAEPHEGYAMQLDAELDARMTPNAGGTGPSGVAAKVRVD